MDILPENSPDFQSALNCGSVLANFDVQGGANIPTPATGRHASLDGNVLSPGAVNEELRDKIQSNLSVSPEATPLSFSSFSPRR